MPKTSTFTGDCYCALVKMRDANSFLFSYTTVIHRNNFQQLKKEQCLDIDFDEFETHLLEMLLLNYNKEMPLKCELSTDESKCRLIFYEKSKIKCLIFLTIEMEVSSQKELFEEMQSNMKLLEETNKTLTRQLTITGDKLKQKEDQIIEHRAITRDLEHKFAQNMRDVNKVFLYNLERCESLLAEKVLEVSAKIMKIMKDINVVKNESDRKSTSKTRLEYDFERLRRENLENISVLNKLKRDCDLYEIDRRSLENEVRRLTQLKTENDSKITDFQNKLEEYRKDLENSAVVIAQKTEIYNELKRDMEQANQVIRNYNKHYELKAQEVDELKEVIKSKDCLIKEQIFQNNQLFKEYQEYKAQFNNEEKDKMLLELSMAQNKIETLEKEKREMVKLNGLLTKKISSTNFFGDPKN